MNIDKKVQAIHDASMKILANAGMVLHHDEIVELVKSHGIKTDGNKVFFTEEQIMHWVKKAPSEFTLYARNPKHDMVIGGKNQHFISATCGFPYLYEPAGERPAVYDDFIKFMKLNQVAPCFDINGGVMITPNDIKNTDVYPSMLLTTMYYSDKCIFGGMGGTVESEHTMNMLKMFFGEKELQEKPRIITIISMNSPLQIEHGMMETMISYVKNGQAIIIAPAVMAGSTGPITMAGTIAVSNAETLVGVAVSQMLKEGTPAIYGSATGLSDMSNGAFCIGSAESALAIKYCTALAKFYDLPCRGGGTLNDALSVTPQAAYEGMMCLLTAASNGMNFMLHSAGQLGSYRSMSFEKYIMDLEVIGMVNHFIKDIDIDDTSLAVDVINEVGPGGEFLTHEHTFENFREATFKTDIAIRGDAEPNASEAEYNARVARKMEKMLDSYVRPDFDASAQKQMEDYLNKINYEVRL